MKTALRDYRFDNLKGLLIFLVVLGHALVRLQSDSMMITRYLYSIIYSFHMPALIFISGYFSKNSHKSENYPYNLLKSLLIPFVVFDLLMWVISSRSIDSLFNPEWTLWYLLSLFFWRMLVVPVSKIRFSLAVTLILSICVGFSPATQLLSVSRTVAFFPIFLIGYKMSSIQIEKLRKMNRFIPVILLALFFSIVVLLRINQWPVDSIFKMDRSYASIEGITAMQGALLRLFALLIGTVSTMCLMIIIPAGQTAASTIGKNTMTVYLGHSFTLRAISRIITIVSIGFLSNEIVVILCSLVLSLLICLAFGNPRVVKIYNKAIERLSAIFLVPNNQEAE